MCSLNARRFASLDTCLISSIFLGAASVSLADPPFFMGLGDLPGGTFESSAYDISGDGLVVVGMSQSGSGPQAFRWTLQGGIVGIGDLPGGSFNSLALDVSADGSVIVGHAHDATRQVAVRWDGLTITPLGELIANGTSQAWGVSPDGTVIVGEADSPAGHEAFRWTAATGMTGIGASSNSIARKTNGSVNVGAGVDPGPWEAFRWENGLLNGIGFLGTGTDSRARDITPDGMVIVGFSTTAPSGCCGKAFRWEGGVMTDLGPPGTEVSSDAQAVSADGSTIVGNASFSPLGGSEPFVWDTTHGMRKLHGVLTIDYCLDLQGFSLGGTSGVSADGTTIVGVGDDPNNNGEGWIAHIPIPVCVKGDFDASGIVGPEDVGPFVGVLLDPCGSTFEERCIADTDLNVRVNGDDVIGFVECLIVGSCP